MQGFCPAFLPFCEQGTPQLTLLIKIQDYCHDNANLTKGFYKIVYLFYNSKFNWKHLELVLHDLAQFILCIEDVVTEQAIFKWYREAHLAKGKRIFLDQMKRIVDWLETAEEESDSEAKDSHMDTT